MKYAIPFTRKFSYWETGPTIEININFKPKIKQLAYFIEQYPEHRINIFVKQQQQLDSALEIISALREKYQGRELILVLPSYRKDLEQKVVESGVPHYYKQLITTWEKFNGFLSLNVTDITIGGEIAFAAQILSEKAKKNQKALRFFCNICQSSWQYEKSLTTFFIRPEDIDLYEPYFDTCEFYYPVEEKHRLNVLYKTYSKDKKWFGRLSLLIGNYHGDEDNKYLIPEFGVRRLSCGKRCCKSEPRTCFFCERSVELAKTLQKNNLYVKSN